MPFCGPELIEPKVLRAKQWRKELTTGRKLESHPARPIGNRLDYLCWPGKSSQGREFTISRLVSIYRSPAAPLGCRG